MNQIKQFVLTKQCPDCHNILDISAFSWYGNVCNGCGAFREKDMKEIKKFSEQAAIIQFEKLNSLEL